jgi:hypothetical protein
LNLSGDIRTFQCEDKLKQFMSTKPALQTILKGIFNTGENEKQSQARKAKKK